VAASHGDVDPALRPIDDEAHRLEESAEYSAQGQFERAKFWRGLNLTLGVGAAFLAAVAGVVGLASDSARILSGVLALIAAGIVSVLTTLNADRRHSQAAAAANAYLEIQTAARQLHAVDLPKLDYDTARAQLAELTARRDEINKTADMPSRRAYRRAQADIERGGQNYNVDKAGRNR
jgi:parvulin-like peptidyl-prolyl isomerase